MRRTVYTAVINGRMSKPGSLRNVQAHIRRQLVVLKAAKEAVLYTHEGGRALRTATYHPHHFRRD